MEKSKIAARICTVIGCLFFVSSLLWLNYLTPKPENIRLINPNLSTTEKAHSTVSQSRTRDGLYWVSFETKGTLFALDSLKIRTISCVDSLTTSVLGEISLPNNSNERCRNFSGFILPNTSELLRNNNQWHFAGSSNGNGMGVVLDKDWTEPKLIFGLVCLGVGLFFLLLGLLPKAQLSEKIFASILLLAAFFLRFYGVFIVSPPEMTIFSDMLAYFHRGWELTRNFYEDSQLFQPVGFTLWSLILRKLGGFDLLNWAQVFSSWGIVVLSFLISRKYFGKLAGFAALIIAGIHVPQIALASFHLAETTYAFLITFTLWLLVKNQQNPNLKNYFFIGALLSLAFYFKGNHAFFIPAFALWVLYKERQNFLHGFKKISIMGIGCALVVLPHLVWTGMKYSKPHLGPTAGALNFVEGKCPSKNNMDSTGTSWMSPLFVQTGENTFKKWPRPFTDQAYFWNEGFNCIKENPAVLLDSLRYVHYLFFDNELWPAMTSPVRDMMKLWNPLSAYFLLPFAVFGALVMARRKDAFTEIAALMMLTLFFTVWFFKSEMRFRIPFDSILFIWSSVGASWAIQHIALPAARKIKVDVQSTQSETQNQT
ncbi:ArnT family glycosyltransferase [Bdellovibrio bacteriovorus]